MRRNVLLLTWLACMLALVLTVAPLQVSAKSLTHASAQMSNAAQSPACGYEWDAESYDSQLDVQLWSDTCTGKWYGVALLLENTYAQVFVDVGGLGGGGYTDREAYLSQGQRLYTGEIYGGTRGAYTCAALTSGGSSVCAH